MKKVNLLVTMLLTVLVFSTISCKKSTTSGGDSGSVIGSWSLVNAKVEMLSGSTILGTSTITRAQIDADPTTYADLQLFKTLTFTSSTITDATGTTMNYEIKTGTDGKKYFIEQGSADTDPDDRLFFYFEGGNLRVYNTQPGSPVAGSPTTQKVTMYYNKI